MMETPRILPLAPAHAAAAHALTQQLRWPHRPEDWARFIRWANTHGLACGLFHRQQLIGTALCWHWSDTHANLGLMIIAREWQGQGLGHRLLGHMLQAHAGRTVSLMATEAGLPLYRQLGFRPLGRSTQYQGIIQSTAAETEAPHQPRHSPGHPLGRGCAVRTRHAPPGSGPELAASGPDHRDRGNSPAHWHGAPRPPSIGQSPAGMLRPALRRRRHDPGLRDPAPLRPGLGDRPPRCADRDGCHRPARLALRAPARQFRPGGSGLAAGKRHAPARSRHIGTNATGLRRTRPVHAARYVFRRCLASGARPGGGRSAPGHDAARRRRRYGLSRTTHHMASHARSGGPGLTGHGLTDHRPIGITRKTHLPAHYP